MGRAVAHTLADNSTGPSQANLAWIYCKTYLIGAWDSVENLLENVSHRLGFPVITPKVATVSLNGKVCIVTGANAGIGFATTELLAKRGAHVIMACRSMQRGEQAAAAVRRNCAQLLPGCGTNAPSVEVMELDCSNLDSVRKFCRSFNARRQPLHLLVANAGIMSPVTRLETPDGLEMQFQVNFLSHWLMANELLGEQRRRRAAQRHLRVKRDSGAGDAAASSSLTQSGWGLEEDATRIVMVTSLTHFAGVLNWSDMQSRNKYDPFTSYALSKLANAMTAVELQRRLDRQASSAAGQAWGVHDTAVAVHPGVVDTHLAKNFFKSSFVPESLAKALPVLPRLMSGAIDALGPILLKTTENSAAGVGCAALGPRDKVAGQYLVNGRASRPAPEVRNSKMAQELWSVAQRLTGLDIHESLM